MTVLGPSLAPPVAVESAELRQLRTEVRSWLRDERVSGGYSPGIDTWLTRWDRAFTKRLAARGWVGMTIPTAYGGHGRTHLERFVVTEELLAAGAPVAMHWVADRQVAPNLLRFGTEEQKQAFLPAIARGECCFAIGMSEPDSGSDLASVRTRAVPADGGWQVTGTKLWTSGAHEADAFVVLARTSPLDPADRHSGLSQLVVDLRAPGVQVRPVLSMDGTHHFNEVHLDDVHVPADRLLGEVGDGWDQVTSELAYERSGPERFLSTFGLVEAWAEGAGDDVVGLGATVARLRALHKLSLATAAALGRGDDPDLPAAVVKLLGTRLEGDLAETAHLSLPSAARGSRYAADVAEALVRRPGFSVRGGTNEVLQGVIARGLGLR